MVPVNGIESYQATIIKTLMLLNWLQLLLPGSFLTENDVVRFHSFKRVAEYLNEVIFTSRSLNYFLAGLVEFFGNVAEFNAAICSDFGFNNAVDSGLDVGRRIGVDVDLGGLKMPVAVVGGGV